ncbi:MAG: ComEC/Rec2 family competence protein [Clostridia bacterium]|nr:ComEC/Rec2 family competence protein [Clostridia bacterium]
MKRIINARIPVLIASIVALGILTGYFISYSEISMLWLIAVVPLTAIIFLFTLILKNKKLMILTAVFAVVFTGGALNSYYTLQNFRVCDVDTEQIYLITGTVKEKGTTTYGEYVITDNVTAYDDKLSGKVRVYLSEKYGDFCDVGYTVQFYTQLKFNDAFPYGELNYYAEDNVKYTCSNYSELKSTYHFSLSGSIRSLIKNTFYENMSSDTASVCYGMMLGDTQYVDDEALENFRYGGIAHIFAVSGLHIGLVYGILTFILKKCRANKYVSAVIRIIAIILYAWICGFAVSSVRAVIMCAINILTRLFHVKSDGLNNLGFAAMLIMFVSPLSLFSVGFQLSVCGIGGIFLFSNLFKRGLTRIKIPDKISSGVSASFGAQVGTFPVMLAKFGYASGIGLLLNILVIPLVSILFTVLFAGTVLSMIIPPAASFIMQYSALPLEAVLSFLVSANFENAIINSFGAGIFVPLYFLVALTVSDKINVKILSRSVLATCGVSVLAICVLAQTYLPANGYKVSVSAYDNDGSVIIKSTQGTVLIMTEDASLSRIKSKLHREYATHLDGVIILGEDNCVEAYDLSLNCKDVYVCPILIPVQPYQTVEVHYEQIFTACGIEFEYIDGQNISALIDGKKILVTAEPTTAPKSCDWVISFSGKYFDELDISDINNINTFYDASHYAK